VSWRSKRSLVSKENGFLYFVEESHISNKEIVFEWFGNNILIGDPLKEGRFKAHRRNYRTSLLPNPGDAKQLFDDDPIENLGRAGNFHWRFLSP